VFFVLAALEFGEMILELLVEVGVREDVGDLEINDGIGAVFFKVAHYSRLRTKRSPRLALVSEKLFQQRDDLVLDFLWQKDQWAQLD